MYAYAREMSTLAASPPFAKKLSSPNTSLTFRPETSFTVLGVGVTRTKVVQ